MSNRLINVKPGKKYIVTKINGSKVLLDSLNNFGITEGQEIHYASKLGSNYIVFCKSVKYGFDKKTAKAIEVEE